MLIKRKLALLAMVGISAPALAAVERIEIKERTAFAPGVTYGEAGAYEKIRGLRAASHPA